MTGKIIKGIAGFYYVEVTGFGIYQCKAKGLFRKEGIKPLVGDMVRITVLHEKDMEANIQEVLPRANELYRPAAANVDQVLIVMALANPQPNFMVLDRFLIQMKKNSLPAIICFNKEDIAKDDYMQSVNAYKAAGYEVIVVSVKKKQGLELLKSRLAKKTTLLAGPSGVGKSSIVNYVSDKDIMEVGEISKKLRKGKNTTRAAQLVVIGEGTYICDTPGFTSFESEDIASDELKQYFSEIYAHEGSCRFLGCVHINEPDCAVKSEVEKGNISSLRYNSYKQLFEELKIKEKNKYR